MLARLVGRPRLPLAAFSTGNTGDYSARQFIEDAIQSNKVVLFMKGTRDAPRCGFSSKTVNILTYFGVDRFLTVDVLADPEVREEIKKYSDWPTIPQLYVNQKFVGGCDVLADMFAQGQLEEFFKSEGVTSDSA